jgi:hypothetical protein
VLRAHCRRGSQQSAEIRHCKPGSPRYPACPDYRHSRLPESTVLPPSDTATTPRSAEPGQGRSLVTTAPGRRPCRPTSTHPGSEHLQIRRTRSQSRLRPQNPRSRRCRPLRQPPRTPALPLQTRQGLCARGEARNSPTLDQCVAGCGNIVRTDHHAARLRERADTLDKKAARTPQPIGDRQRTNANRLRSYADHHDHTRITRQETPA